MNDKEHREHSEAYNRVVIGVDGSEDGLRAVDFGVREAQSRGCDILLAHAVDDAVLAGAWGVVYDPGVLREGGQEATDQAEERARAAGMPADRVHSEIYMGNPGAILTRLSEEAQSLVVGRRAMSGLERLFVGSTSVGVAATAHCPVIMVSAANHPAVTGGLGRIGVGVDGSTRSADALTYAFEEAARRGVKLEIVHAFELPAGFFADQKNREERTNAQLEAAKEAISELVKPLQDRFPEVAAETHVVANHPVKELLSRTADLDLMVLGVHGVGLPGLSPGATIRALMAHSECPLTLVRPDARH